MNHHPSVRNHMDAKRRRKRIRVAFALAFILGPLGLFYTNPFGGFVTFSMLLISLLIQPLAGLILVWIACLIWAVLTARKPRNIFQVA